MKAFLTISRGDDAVGTLRLTLRPDIVPKTVENFTRYLTCHRDSPANTTDGIGYCNSSFHRIIPKFMAQGGDFLNNDGTGSTSIYGTSFADENFLLSHSQRGILSMANSGANTNGCQFFITFGPTAHLDGKHVVFGSVDWRDDEESARVLDQLEKVRTDRRNDRPVERVQIIECGLIQENKGSGKLVENEVIVEKLIGEAKKNKLMQAYGQVDCAGNIDPAADDDEIDLDDAEKHDDTPSKETTTSVDESGYRIILKTTDNEGDIDIEGEYEEPADDQVDSDILESDVGGMSTKKGALQKRLAVLRTKINQCRTLNRREVHAEAKRMGTDEASAQDRRRQNREDKNLRQKEYETFVVDKLKSVGQADLKPQSDDEVENKRLASLTQSASESIRRMNARADKVERSQYGPNDYYNPEGQYSNYERNLKSVRHNMSKRGGVAATGSSTLDSYDPTETSFGENSKSENDSSERDGAKRLANEMKRRAEKRSNQKRKPDFDSYDVSYINDRNKRFNEKISRNFDEHTAEIRQNLERGTAL